MLRRTVRIACPAVYRIKALQQEPEMSYQQKVREMQEAEMRGKAGPGHRVVTNMIADHHDNDARSSQTKYGKMGKETDGDFTTTKEELRQWMNVKHAAKLLGIPEKKLFALKPDEVTDAFRFEFARATNIRTRTELEAAAELLYEYTGSELLREKTLDHYAETIINAKKEIASDIDKQKSRSRDMMFRGLGFGHLLVTTLFASSIVLMYRYVEEHDAEVAIVRARRVFAGSMCHPVNYEPAPEYQTRYRDTPTCLDELQQQPHRDITDPTHRSLLLEADNATQREEEFLASIAEDVAGEAIRQQRENERQARIDLEKSLRGLGMLGMADSVVERARPRVIRELADGYATFVGEDTATSTPAA